MSERGYFLASSPHIGDRDSVSKVMFTVVLALLPAVAASVWFFGLRALLLVLATALSALLFEGILLKIARKNVKEGLLDGSALVTGVLLALNLPSGMPIWMVMVGTFIGILFGKHVFGGLGNNPFNPALVARVFLLVSFPTAMTTWPVAGAVDGATAATPLGILRMEGIPGIERWLGSSGYLELLWGNRGGSLGEVSVIALLLGAAILVWRKVITLDIPLAFILTVAVFTDVAHLMDPTKYAHPLFHVMNGGLILGAFFMATDMVTSPVTFRGRVLFGIGCGLLTALIRLWGGYPEGVSFAILIMNSLVPIIDRFTVPRVFGATPGQAEAR